MFDNIIKLFLKIILSLSLILINVLFLLNILLNDKPAYSKNIQVETNLAFKYCDAKERNLFKGLENERVLKYEYFFNSIKKEKINQLDNNLSNFVSEVENICMVKLDKKELGEFKLLLRYPINTKKPK